MTIKRYVSIIKWVVGSILLVYVISNLYSKKHLLIPLLNISVSSIIFFVIIHIINLFLLGAVHYYGAKSIDIELDFHEWFGISAIANLLNLVSPAKAGTLIRYPFLKSKKNLSFKQFIQLMSYTTLLGMIAMGFCATIIIAISTKDIRLSLPYIILLISGLIGITLLKKYKENIFSLTSLKIVILFSLMTLIYPLKTYLSFSSLGLESDLNINQFVQLSMIGLLISLLPILPNSMGIKEIIMGQAMLLYNMQTEYGQAATLIERVILFLTLLPLGSYYFIKILRPKNIHLKFSKQVLENA